MAGLISKKELQNDTKNLKTKVNGNLCPTEFSGKALNEFMARFEKGDTLESVPIFDPFFERETVALVLRRENRDIIILQRGKPIGD